MKLNNITDIKSKIENYKIPFSDIKKIVNAIKQAYETQISALKENDLRKFGEQCKWIGGLSDIYSKLCKK